MKKVFLTLIFLTSFLIADTPKEFTLACNSYEDISNVKKIEQTMKNRLIPKNCIFLTNNANVSIVDTSLPDKKFVKILIIDLGIHMYTLKEDIIVTNENKI